MEEKTYHVFINKHKVITRIPSDKYTLEEAYNLISDKTYLHLGTYSEFYQINKSKSLRLYIRKDIMTSTKPFNLFVPDYNSKGLGVYSKEFSSSLGCGFSKQDLLDLANNMEDNDKLLVMVANIAPVRVEEY